MSFFNILDMEECEEEDGTDNITEPLPVNEVAQVEALDKCAQFVHSVATGDRYSPTERQGAGPSTSSGGPAKRKLTYEDYESLSAITDGSSVAAKRRALSECDTDSLSAITAEGSVAAQRRALSVCDDSLSAITAEG